MATVQTGGVESLIGVCLFFLHLHISFPPRLFCVCLLPGCSCHGSGAMLRVVGAQIERESARSDNLLFQVLRFGFDLLSGPFFLLH